MLNTSPYNTVPYNDDVTQGDTITSYGTTGISIELYEDVPGVEIANNA